MSAPVREEPEWLLNLRACVWAARELSPRASIANVRIADLEEAIGCVQDGPGGVAMIGRLPNGDICVDYQKLLKCVYMTPVEAMAFAGTILVVVRKGETENAHGD